MAAMDSWQDWAAVVCAGLGAVVTVVGVVTTWTTHRPAGKRFWTPYVAPVDRGWRAVVRWVRRVLLRLPETAPTPEEPPGVRLRIYGVSATGWAPLPADPDQWRTEVEDHLSRLTMEAHSDRSDIRNERSAREAAVAEVDTRLGARLDALEGQVHQVATEGLREQVVGVVLVVLGLVFSVWAGLVDDPPPPAPTSATHAPTLGP